VLAVWRRSGKKIGAFAHARGIRPRTLSWWKWRLEGPGILKQRDATLRLVPVDVEPAARSLPVAARSGWELITVRGRLRVHESLGVTELQTVLAMLVDGNRPT